MKTVYKPDNPVTDAACKKATGKTLKQWFAELDKNGGAEKKRRDRVLTVYENTDKDIWWSTTVAVEYERAKGELKKDGRVEGYNICVTKTVAAPTASAYMAFADVKTLKKWYDKGIKAKIAEGGSFDDGNGNTGEYLRVRKGKDIRFSWNNDRAESPTRVDVTFSDSGKGKTLVTLTHQRIQNRAEADGLRNAWGAAFDRLKSTLES